MAEARTPRYYTYDGTRRSRVPRANETSDEAAAAYGEAHGAWNVVREDGPLAKATSRFVFQR